MAQEIKEDRVDSSVEAISSISGSFASQQMENKKNIQSPTTFTIPLGSCSPNSSGSVIDLSIENTDIMSPYSVCTLPSPLSHGLNIEIDNELILKSDPFERLNITVDVHGVLHYKDTNKKITLKSLQSPRLNAAGLIDAIIYQAQERLIHHLSYSKILVPSVADAVSPLARADIYASPNWCTCDNLIIIINSSRGARPGIWSRTLSIEEGIFKGSMVPFLERAKNAGYAVMILNPNLNTVTLNNTKVPIEGSRTPGKRKK